MADSTQPFAADAGAIVVDEADNDNASLLADSALGSDAASDTTSLKSVALKFHYEFGRRYTSEESAAYYFPNDEDELDRMDLDHAVWKLMLGGQYFLAPLKEPQHVLDLGTGSGIWAIEVADLLPAAHVIGTDLAPVQPQLVPPNCEFQVDDFENLWTWGDRKFDLVHTRSLFGSVVDYPKLLRNTYDALKPGGWFEMHDLMPDMYCDDDSLPKDAKILQLGPLIRDAVTPTGRTCLPLDGYKKHFEDAGFVNVKEVMLRRPNGPWAKDPKLKQLGLWTLANLVDGMHAFTMFLFTKMLGWRQDEVEVYCAEVRKEVCNPKSHTYQRCIAIYGQKPA